MPTLMACVPVMYDTAARERHVTMSLVVSDANVKARHLYEALGFVTTSESRTLRVPGD